VDVGPARSWDEKTSGVGTGISKDNKLIGLVTHRDIYLPKEVLTLRFIRMTAFPIGVNPEFRLIRQTVSGEAQDVVKFLPSFSTAIEDPCPQFRDINQMASIQWQIPPDIPAGRYKVFVRFCKCLWKEMPSEISTSEFEIIRPDE
jgi:hypothetical protein